MCGIFAVLNDKSNRAAQTVCKGLKQLEYRGYDSWGISLQINRKATNKLISKLLVEKHVGKIGEAKTTLPKGKIAIGHTRWATHGGITDENAHPHLDCTKQIAVIHNGIVENYQELKTTLLYKGHKFNSETDSEVIAHLVEENLKTKNIKDAVFFSFKKLVGLNAVVCLHASSNTIIGCRNGSPLVAGIGEDEYFLASDTTPFLGKTRKAVFIKDNEGVVLSMKGVDVFSLKNKRKMSVKIEKIDWQKKDTQKKGHPHFLIKEIMEQKKTITKTVSLNEKEIKNIAKKVSKFNKIVLFGCGTAFYCTKLSEYYFSNTKLNVISYGAYEFLPFSNKIDDNSIAIAVSQSGETADTLIAAKAAKKNKTFLIAVVNVIGSSLERLANVNLNVGAGPEIAVVSTKAFTSQLATLYLLSKALSGKYIEGRKNLKKLEQKLKVFLNKKLQLKVLSLAKKLIDYQDMYIIGKHLNYPAALEFALKLKETSYLHAEAFASGELKHGVISLIQKNTPCVVLASNDEVKDEVISSAQEIKARGGKIVGVAPFKTDVFDEYIQTPDLGELTVFGNIIVGQMLGYFLGVGRGTDPDKPRNLAKSVTVK